jgi:hypothetical protein
MVESITISFIKDVGFPIAAFLLMYALYINATKQSGKRIADEINRYDALVNKFINTLAEISKNNNIALEKNTIALVDLGNKLDRHMEQKDAFIDLIKEERRNHG